MINSDAVFVEREGRLERVPGALPKPIQIRRAVLAIARQLGDNISEQQPLLDARLPDGSRIAAALPPCSFGGPVLTIRKFSRNRLYLEDLVASNTLTPSLATAIQQAVTTRQNLMISGGTGTGKTTLLAAITKLIPEDERILVIEDTVELPLESQTWYGLLPDGHHLGSRKSPSRIWSRQPCGIVRTASYLVRFVGRSLGPAAGIEYRTPRITDNLARQFCCTCPEALCLLCDAVRYRLAVHSCSGVGCRSH